MGTRQETGSDPTLRTADRRTPSRGADGKWKKKGPRSSALFFVFFLYVNFYKKNITEINQKLHKCAPCKRVCIHDS